MLLLCRCLVDGEGEGRCMVGRQAESNRDDTLAKSGAEDEAGYVALEDVIRIMDRLLAPDGCSWDRRQTHETLKPYVIEEAHEVIAAIDEGNPEHLAEELGDLLLQVVFHAALGERAGTFGMTDVIRAICEKLIRRHPDIFPSEQRKLVFPQEKGENSDWESIKRRERAAANEVEESLLDAVTPGLPAMLQAQKMQGRAGLVGFDWRKAEAAWAKVEEELS